jgi:uracil-DNA glycosylase
MSAGYEAGQAEQFARIVGCARCTIANDRNLLRDADENVPQPGYIGANYPNTRVLLVGQNPKADPTSRLAAEDRHYTAALRALRDEPTAERYAALAKVLAEFIPRWPVHGGYFPLDECDLDLDDIAYCNVVRCRTMDDRIPGVQIFSACVREHFSRWLDYLSPKVVVFIGKRAWEGGNAAVEARGIPSAFMNRRRSLSSEERQANRAQVVSLVRHAIDLVSLL